MSSTSFEKLLRREVAELADKLDLDEDTAFAAWYAKVAFRLDDEDALEAISYGGGNDRGIDLLHTDDDWETIVIGQSRYYKSSSKAPKVADLTLLFNTLEELEDPQELRDAGRADLADAAEELVDARGRGFAIKLIFVYPGKTTPDLERLVRNFNRKRLRENVSVQLVPLDELELTYEDYTGTAGRVPEGELQLLDAAYFEQDSPTFGRALVGSIAGTSLQAIYKAHGNRLFEQNVRLFLGTRKGSVNAGIRDTLTDATERSNFWAYNNGISIVATDFELDEGTGVVTLKEFSIVNGCQTTVSIGDASHASAQEASVLARILAAPPSLVDNIIRYTNSQNQFAVWDISARDKVQQRLSVSSRSSTPRGSTPSSAVSSTTFRTRTSSVPTETGASSPSRLAPSSSRRSGAFRWRPTRTRRGSSPRTRTRCFPTMWAPRTYFGRGRWERPSNRRSSGTARRSIPTR